MNNLLGIGTKNTVSISVSKVDHLQAFTRVHLLLSLQEHVDIFQTIGLAHRENARPAGPVV